MGNALSILFQASITFGETVKENTSDLQEVKVKVDENIPSEIVGPQRRFRQKGKQKASR
jgi:hypothetical protein